ncbi:TonB-dependent receptor [Sphingomonas sp. Leaf339]|uniref:TonB-dependent receptor n=1 Tax=Sphingomonas sp. Leaf339 TaxID=1736343 RepID=UPI0006FB23D6|nr:TonB-dependent receptor [Sphingomonas sp. Leaf339]KQU56098.1 TonB-dependent receptor [Sphingomonas sp. Leaf339]
MRGFTARSLSRLVIGTSALALVGLPGMAVAQDAAATLGNPGSSDIQDTPTTSEPTTGDDIVVTGIRASLRESVDIKRDGQGIVDAISAEDIGKFPDTNLAESLQRITGVSIDRSNGEGSFVTVRGFGPEFNMVTLNGRQMPTSSLGDGLSAPSSRSFDFANLASEGISAVEVYKTGRAAVPSGGIGSSINIRTPRPLDKPGFRGSVAAKGVLDTSRNGKDPITPEVSGIISSTFADNRIGVLLTGIYQRRKASVNNASVGYRDGYLGSENNWGSLAQPGDPRAANITNRPDATDVYEVPQNAGYDFTDIDRERINGQLVLQFRPVDDLTATVDYTYSRNDIEGRNSSVGIWFNHNDTSSAWTDGPVAGPVFYTERFGANEGKDLAYSGALTASRSENKSLGGNLTWNAPGGVTMTLDAHHSTAESKPTNRYGNSVSVGNAVFGIQNQTINFENYLPVLSYNMYPGIDPLNVSLITPTGNAFRNSYFKDRINQVQLAGHYDHDGAFLDSIDFGVSYVNNKVRSAYGVIQNDTWGGAGPASDIPDDIFHLANVPDKFDGLGGANDPTIIKQFYTFDFERMVELIDRLYKTCGGDNDCRAPFTTDRRTTEKTLSPFIQINNKFDLFSRPAHLIAGVRYDQTLVNSSALVPVPSGTRWVSQNEFGVIYSGASAFTRFKGEYQNWLPAFDFDMQPIENVKLRASYSHTITRADYASLQGGRTIDQLFRVGGGTGQQGNPGLIPYKSKNIDLSAEWYYSRESYISVGYFHKNVENFISSTQVNTPAFDLTNPASGPRYRAAVAALGANASGGAIRDYIFTNFPTTTRPNLNAAGGFVRDATGFITGDIFGVAGDDPVNFQIGTPVNSDQTGKIEGFEFAIQHQFWDTGFGTILNYTIVNGDARYNNALPSSVTQFALVGLSDSANAVGYYDKNGIQARVAYNWRAKFLSGTGLNPFYVQAYGQVDASASYEFTKGLTAFVEAINLTGSSRRGHRRSENNVTFVQPGYARYSAGMRFSF